MGGDATEAAMAVGCTQIFRERSIEYEESHVRVGLAAGGDEVLYGGRNGDEREITT